jgi:segregation and condensation protein B
MRKPKHKRRDEAASSPEVAPEVRSEVRSEAGSDFEGENTAVEVISTVDDAHRDGDFAGEDTAVEVHEAAPDIVAEEDVATASGEAVAVDATHAVGETESATVAGADEPLPEVEGSRLESIIESLLFAADRPLMISDLKRLLGSRDAKRMAEALEGLRVRRADTGIQLVSVAGGWQLRTNPGNGAWVAKLVAGRPPRLSRAMMETLSIVAYRQPITRPEIDEIRGVDCGPVLRTLLDRSLIRVIGKKEEVGRPILYGTTPEFLKVFSLRDLTDLPTLREFHELGADDRAEVDAATGAPAESTSEAQPGDQASGGGNGSGSEIASESGPPPARVSADESSAVREGLSSNFDPDEDDALIDALDRATEAAARATRSATEPDADHPDVDPGQRATETETEADAARASTSPRVGPEVGES